MRWQGQQGLAGPPLRSVLGKARAASVPAAGQTKCGGDGPTPQDCCNKDIRLTLPVGRVRGGNPSILRQTISVAASDRPSDHQM